MSRGRLSAEELRAARQAARNLPDNDLDAAVLLAAIRVSGRRSEKRAA